MKTLVIVSDSHSNTSALEKLEPIIAENDYFVFLGDGLSDIMPVFRKYPEKTYFVRGNCDFSTVARETDILDIEGHRIAITHGHRFSVKNSLDEYKKFALENDCDIALYGHTHVPLLTEEDGVTLINPGTLSRYGEQTYCYLVLTREKAVATFVVLKNY